MKTDIICDNSYETCLLERPRYFPRQLITPADMTLEQRYFRDKFRRHNRLLHGWGVVCGALVCPVPTPDGKGMQAWKVIVKPGYILGPYGDEILIDCERTFDLRVKCVTGVAGEPCGEPPADPWCSEVFVQRRPGDKLYVAVRYKEVMTRPVRVQPVGCGCDETQCEYSRWCDGYEICVLTECPKSHQRIPHKTPAYEPWAGGKVELGSPEIHGGERLPFKIPLGGAIPECPPCPPEPWVVLAEVEIDENGIIKRIDNCSCRRMVISFGHFWWRCRTDLPEVREVNPAEVSPGQKNVLLTVSGRYFEEGLQVELGQGIAVISDTINVGDDGNTFTVRVNVGSDAALGWRTLTVVNPDCATATLANAVKVEEVERPEKPEEGKPETEEREPAPPPKGKRPRGRREKE